MAAAKGGQRLVYQRAIGRQLLSANRQIGGFVGHHVQRHTVPQILAAEVQPGQHRRIDQRGVIGLGPAGVRAVLRFAIQRAGHAPSVGKADAGCDPDLARVISGRVEAHLIPLQVDDLVGHGNAPGDDGLGGAQRRGVDEIGHHLLRARGQIEVEGEDLHRIAPPAHRLAVGKEMEVDQFLDRARRRMGPGDPLRQLQNQRVRTRRQRNGLGHMKIGADGVGRVHIQRDRPARPWRVGRIGHGAGRGHGGWRRMDGWIGGGRGRQRGTGASKAEGRGNSQRGGGPISGLDHRAFMPPVGLSGNTAGRAGRAGHGSRRKAGMRQRGAASPSGRPGFASRAFSEPSGVST